MPIDIDIAHVARLARLELSEEELAHYKAQLGVILDHAARVQSFEGETEDQSIHPLGLVNVYRPDLRGASLDRAEVLEQAPETSDGYFAVPPAMESE